MTIGAIKKINISDENALFCPMIDARRMEVYCALYDSKLNEVKSTSAVVIAENLFSEISEGKTIYYFGDGSEKCIGILKLYKNFIFIPDILPSAKSMTSLALKSFIVKKFENLSLFEPDYLKEYKPGIKKI
jgi:tRNA threonylcarbamoyladenosine biosynthesis protein TsaB